MSWMQFRVFTFVCVLQQNIKIVNFSPFSSCKKLEILSCRSQNRERMNFYDQWYNGIFAFYFDIACGNTHRERSNIIVYFYVNGNFYVSFDIGFSCAFLHVDFLSLSHFFSCYLDSHFNFFYINIYFFIRSKEWEWFQENK